MYRSGLLLCLLPALALAQDLTLDADAVYARYDEDGDAALSEDEFARMYEEEVVNRASAEGPAQVQQQAMPLPSREISFDELDVDGDGLVGIEELRANPDLSSLLGRDERAPRS